MAIFNSYVSLPEGTVDDSKFVFTKVGWGDGYRFNGQWLPQLHFFPDPDGISPLSVNPHYYLYGHYGHFALIPVIMAKYG